MSVLSVGDSQFEYEEEGKGGENLEYNPIDEKIKELSQVLEENPPSNNAGKSLNDKAVKLLNRLSLSLDHETLEEMIKATQAFSKTEEVLFIKGVFLDLRSKIYRDSLSPEDNEVLEVASKEFLSKGKVLNRKTLLEVIRKEKNTLSGREDSFILGLLKSYRLETEVEFASTAIDEDELIREMIEVRTALVSHDILDLDSDAVRGELLAFGKTIGKILSPEKWLFWKTQINGDLAYLIKIGALLELRKRSGRFHIPAEEEIKNCLISAIQDSTLSEKELISPLVASFGRRHQDLLTHILISKKNHLTQEASSCSFEGRVKLAAHFLKVGLSLLPLKNINLRDDPLARVIADQFKLIGQGMREIFREPLTWNEWKKLEKESFGWKKQIGASVGGNALSGDYFYHLLLTESVLKQTPKDLEGSGDALKRIEKYVKTVLNHYIWTIDIPLFKGLIDSLLEESDLFFSSALQIYRETLRKSLDSHPNHMALVLANMALGIPNDNFEKDVVRDGYLFSHGGKSVLMRKRADQLDESHLKLVEEELGIIFKTESGILSAKRLCSQATFAFLMGGSLYHLSEKHPERQPVPSMGQLYRHDSNESSLLPYCSLSLEEGGGKTVLMMSPFIGFFEEGFRFPGLCLIGVTFNESDQLTSAEASFFPVEGADSFISGKCLTSLGELYVFEQTLQQVTPILKKLMLDHHRLFFNQKVEAFLSKQAHSSEEISWVEDGLEARKEALNQSWLSRDSAAMIGSEIYDLNRLSKSGGWELIEDKD